MKKALLIVAAILGLAVVASAQPRALGIRAGYGAELSYQHTLGGQNFIEADLGWALGNPGGLDLGLSYDFIIAPLGPLNFLRAVASASVSVPSSVLSIPSASRCSSPSTGVRSSRSCPLPVSAGAASASVSATLSDRRFHERNEVSRFRGTSFCLPVAVE